MHISSAQQQLLAQFNQNSTVLIISSYPRKAGESSLQNAVANYTRELAQSMAETTPVVVICEYLAGEEEIYLEKNVLIIRAYRKGSLAMPVQLARAIGLLPKVETVMVQFEFNIFGTPLSTTTFIPLLVWLRYSGKKITFMFHQVVDSLQELGEHLGVSNGFSLKTTALNWGMRTFYRAVGLISDGVVVHTEELRSKLCQYISDHKITCIPHGVTLPSKVVSRAAARKQLGVAVSETVLLVFGYINWYKGADWIIKTVGELAKEHPERKLRLIMAGGESATLKETAHYQAFLKRVNSLVAKYSDVVTITGYVPDAEKSLYFQAADLVVLPYRVSMSESGPLSHVFGYGKAYMVSEARYSSLTYADVRHALFTYEVDPHAITFSLEKQEFKQKLFAILDNKTLQRNIKNSAAFIGEQRNWKSVAALYIRALHKGYARTAKKLAEQEVKLSELSAFFPLYNEEANVVSLVEHAQAVLPHVAKKYEIILVNDGSTDATAGLCEKMAEKYPEVRVVHQKNKGYGGALKTGFRAAQYEWIFFSDGDLQFDLNELAQFVPFTLLHDLVLGYRISRAEGFKRALFAKMLKVWNRLFLAFPLRIKDIDCAFKLVHRRVLQSIEPLQCDGAMISTEFLIKSYQRGISFTQLGVTHYKRAAGSATGSDFGVIKRAVLETVQLRSELQTTAAGKESAISLATA